MKSTRLVNTIIGLLVLVLLTGCQNADALKEDGQSGDTLKIARQYGLAYAPLTIMEDKKLIEKHAPGLEVEWVQLGNTAAIREAILSDALDIGFMGIPPFLIGSENGMDWEIFTGLSSAPVGLMTNREDAKSLSDINEIDRIALPQPGSIQHILLSMAAERELGNAKAFDDKLVSLKHPDGMQMLLSDSEITMHFTSPPYNFMEENEGMIQVLSGKEAFGGDFTFIVGTLRKEMAEKNETVKAVQSALEETMDFLMNNRDESVEILSEAYGIDAETLRGYLYDKGIEYTHKVEGLEDFVEFMIHQGYLSESMGQKTLVWSE